MKTILTMSGIVALAFSAAVIADPTNVPMEQGFESVGRNIARDPDNEGLRNANERLLENQRRQADRGRNHAPGQQRIERIERVERPERPERVERVDLATRSEIVRAQRPERPNRGNGKGR